VYQMFRSAYATYFHDITSGNNGYAAGPNYDLVTGLGTPHADQVIQALMNATGSGSTLTLAKPSGTGSNPGSGVTRGLVTHAEPAPEPAQAVVPAPATQAPHTVATGVPGQTAPVGSAADVFRFRLGSVVPLPQRDGIPLNVNVVVSVPV